jgi:uncharacterized repeat protein (TIGR03833 family)
MTAHDPSDVKLWAVIDRPYSYATAMNGQVRANIWPGLNVRVVEKQNQRTGHLTEGIVQKLLTSSPTHPHGIKVMLVGGVVGRVKEILH